MSSKITSARVLFLIGLFIGVASLIFTYIDNFDPYDIFRILAVGLIIVALAGIIAHSD